MADEGIERSRRGGVVRTQRLKAFSDGVFAIAITLLVLDIAAPAATSDDVLAALAAQWPSYAAYVVSFASIGALWVVHTAMTEYLQRADALILRLNLLVLFLVTLLPFPTRLVEEYVGEDDAERVAVAAYGLVLLAAWVALMFTLRYAARAGLFGEDIGAHDLQDFISRMSPGIGGYVLFLVIGLFRPTVGFVGYLALAVFYLLPVVPGLRRLRRGRPDADAAAAT